MIILRGMKSSSLITRGYNVVSGVIGQGYHEIVRLVLKVAIIFRIDNNL